MNSALTSIKPMSLVLAGVVVASTAVVGISLSVSSKADFALAASPTTASVTPGQVANYGLTENALNGFSGSVALSITGLPAGANATFSPNPMLKGSTTSALAVDTAGTSPGTSTLTVTGVSGTLTHTVTVTLTVTTPPPPAFTIGASPASASMLPGDTASYAVSISRASGFTGSVALSVASGLPSGGTATFTPANLTGSGSTSTLTVSTKNNSPSGVYTLTVNGVGSGQTQSTSVNLSLASSGKSFGIVLVTPLPALLPGARRPMDLKLTNLNSQAISVTNLTVALQSVTKAADAPADKPCGVSDFTITQFSGSYPLTVPAGGTFTVSSAVLDNTLWPAITMTDAAGNQDGCHGAKLQFSFSGAGQG
jgi:uncharacterized membrane protein